MDRNIGTFLLSLEVNHASFNSFNLKDNARTTVYEATLEFAVLIADSLASSVLTVLVLGNSLKCGINSCLFGKHVSNLLAFKPKC